MATINWPNPTSVGQLYTSTNGDVWRWTGQYWQSVGTSSIGGTGAANQVTLWSGTNSLTGTSAIAYTNTPGTNVNITISDSGFGSILGRGTIDVSVSNGSATSTIRSGSNATQINPVLEFKRAKNSLVVPNTLTVGTYIGETKYSGAYDSLGNYRTSVTIRSEATETWSSIASGTKFAISTMSNGQFNGVTERFSIEGNGLIRFYGSYTFPNSNGIVNQVLSTNGAGTLSWATITAASIGAISGSGTLNFHAKWTGSGITLGNSLLQDNGTSIAMGTNPSSTYGLYINYINGQSAIFGQNTWSVAGQESIGVVGVASGASGSNNIGGAFGSAGNLILNIGVRGTSDGNIGSNIGGVFQALNGASNYAIQLKDGTQTIAGRFLKNMTTDGKANWVNITTADVAGSVGGTGVNGRLTIWTGSTSLYSDYRLLYTIGTDNTITVGGANNQFIIGGSNSTLTSTSSAKLGLTTVNNSNIQYSIFTLTHARGTTGAQTPVFNGDILGDFRFDGGAGYGAFIRSQATIAHAAPSTRGSDLQFWTVNNSNVDAIRIRINSAGAIRFNEVYTFPTTDGTANQVLSTNGSGTLSWSTPTTGSVSGNGTLNYIPKWTSSTALGNSLLRDDGSTTSINTSPNSLIQLLVYTDKTVGIAVSNYSTSGNRNTGFQSVVGGTGPYNVGYLAQIEGGTSYNIGGRFKAGTAGDVTIFNPTGFDFGVHATADHPTRGNIGGYFTATGATAYSLMLSDGTQAAGKFLKSITSDGKARWANITTADISGLLTGAGATNKVAYWSNGTNLTYDSGVSITPGINPILQVQGLSPGTTGLASITPTSIAISSNNANPLISLQSQNSLNYYPIISLGRWRPGGTGLLDGDTIAEQQFANSGMQGAVIRTRAEGNAFNGVNAGTSFGISTISRNANTSTIIERIGISGGFQNPITLAYSSPIIKLRNSTIEIGTIFTTPTKTDGSRKYQVVIGTTDAQSGLYVTTSQAGAGLDPTVTSITGESINSSGNRIGVYGIAGQSTISNIGVKGEVSVIGAGALSVGGHFLVPNNSNSYALWLQDGTQAIGKVVKSITSDGKARWAEPEPYQVYTAYINQTGGTAPVPTLYRNTITGAVSFSYNAVGSYSVVSTGFTVNKIWVSFTPAGGPVGRFFQFPTGSGVVYINSYISSITLAGGGTLSNGILSGFLEIRVYP